MCVWHDAKYWGHWGTVPSFKKYISRYISRKLVRWWKLKELYFFSLIRKLSEFIKHCITVCYVPLLEKVEEKRITHGIDFKWRNENAVGNNNYKLFIKLLLLIKHCVVKHTLGKWSYPWLNTRITWRAFNNSDV